MKQRARKHRCLRYLLIGLFLLFGLAVAFRMVRFRNSTVVHATQDFRPGAEAVLYRQDDARWAEDRLGSSTYTMKSSGCLVSCIASAVSMRDQSELTPAVLNQRFSEAQVYDAGGNIQWEPLRNLGEWDVDVYSAPSGAIIEECLAAGRYPIVRVRMHGYGNFHYVLIIGAEDGTFICMDPLQDELQDLAEYGNRVYAIRCVY